MEILIISSNKEEAVRTATEILGILNEGGISGCHVGIFSLDGSVLDEEFDERNRDGLMESLLARAVSIARFPAPELQKVALSFKERTVSVVDKFPESEFNRKFQKRPDFKKKIHFLNKRRQSWQKKR